MSFYYAFTITFYIGGLFAFTDEIHQLFVEGRSGQISDFGIDVLGLVTGMSVCVGIYAFYIICRKIYQLFKFMAAPIQTPPKSRQVKELQTYK